MSHPLAPLVEFLEMSDRSDTHPDQEEWAESFRQTLAIEYGLDLTDPRILAAVCAGLVEGMVAAREHGSSVRGALAGGKALVVTARPHLRAAAQQSA